MRKVVAIGPEKIARKPGSRREAALPPQYALVSYQPQLVNLLYLDQNFAEKNTLMQMLNRKLLGYRQQDTKNKIFSEKHFVTDTDTIQKLVESKMRCVYCRCALLFVYNIAREPTQWTLDRVNNDMGHNLDNVVISCLGCNLSRRTTDMDKFLFTKQLCIRKMI